jgi:hypothetical protein
MPKCYLVASRRAAAQLLVACSRQENFLSSLSEALCSKACFLAIPKETLIAAHDAAESLRGKPRFTKAEKRKLGSSSPSDVVNDYLDWIAALIADLTYLKSKAPEFCIGQFVPLGTHIADIDNAILKRLEVAAREDLPYAFLAMGSTPMISSNHVFVVQSASLFRCSTVSEIEAWLDEEIVKRVTPRS